MKIDLICRSAAQEYLPRIEAAAAGRETVEDAAERLHHGLAFGDAPGRAAPQIVDQVLEILVLLRVQPEDRAIRQGVEQAGGVDQLPDRHGRPSAKHQVVRQLQAQRMGARDGSEVGGRDPGPAGLRQEFARRRESSAGRPGRQAPARGPRRPPAGPSCSPRAAGRRSIRGSRGTGLR